MSGAGVLARRAMRPGRVASGLRGRGGRLAPALLGLVLGALALGPGLGPGFVLRYDMVFVPSPPWSASALGLVGGPPRAFPSTAVVTALATLLPAAVVQKAILLSIFTLAAAGADRLLPGAPLPARLAAAAAYVWNPYMAERLLIGQWALLLGYAALPWAVHAATRLGPAPPPAPASSSGASAAASADPSGTGHGASGPAGGGDGVNRPAGRNGWVGRLGGRGWWRRAGALAVALVPAAVGGFAAMTICAPAVVAAAVIRPARRVRAGLTALAVLVVLALPWLVPALLGPALTTDPAGVDAFGARADTPFGTLGSLLALGGVWNREVVPSGYGHGPAAYLWLAFVIAGVVAYLVHPRCAARVHAGAADGSEANSPPGSGRSRGVAAVTSEQEGRRTGSAARSPQHGGGGGVTRSYAGRFRNVGWSGLLVGAVVGYGIAAFGAVGPGRDALRWLVGAVPAFGVVRDGQRFVAPVALVVAIGVGVGARALLRACARRGAAGPGRALAGVAAVVPLMLLPTLAFGAAGRIAAVSYPPDWTRARTVVDGDPAPGAVLILPWAAYKRFSWNGGRTVVDPAPTFFARRVVWNDGLRVGNRTLAAENPAARAITAALVRPGPVIGPGARITGTSMRVRYVLVEHGPGQAGDRPGRATVERILKGRVHGRRPAIFPVLEGTDISLYRLVTSR